MSVSISRRRPGRERSTRSIIASSRSRGSKRRRSSSVLSRNVSTSASARTRNCQRWSGDREVEPRGEDRDQDARRHHQQVEGEDLAEQRGPSHGFTEPKPARLGCAPGQISGPDPIPVLGLPWTILVLGMAAGTLGTRSPESVVGDMNKATQANWKAGLRTTILLATLTGLLVGLGHLIGGPSTALMFLFIGLAFNLVMFWFSDKIALKMSRAEPLSEEEAPRLHQMVRELAHSAGIPMPRLYMIPASQPNAFATGRSPKHSAVAVTRGHHAAAQRERAARRDRPRAGPHPQPRHPDHRRSRPRSAARSPGWATCCCSWAATTTARWGSSERWRW